MKIIVQNYTDKLTTEPMYLTQALQAAGIDTYLWNTQQVSVYDLFDSVQPTHLVCHWRYISNDLVDYLNQPNCKIKVAINVTGATEAQMKSIGEVFSKVKCFHFTNSVKAHGGAKTLWPAHDIFNVKKVMGVPNISFGVCAETFSEKVSEFVGNKDVYHLLYIGANQEKEPEFDLTINATNIAQLFPIYKQFHIHGNLDLCASQVFFDAIMACPLSVDCEDKEGWDNFLNTCMKTPKGYSESDHIVESLRKTIRQNHTPFHRAARLMKIIGENEAMQKVEVIKSRVSQQLEQTA